MPAGWVPSLSLWLALLILGCSAGALWLGLRLGFRPGACISLGALSLLGLMALALLLASGWNPGALAAGWKQEFETSLSYSAGLYRQMGLPETEVLQALQLVRKLFWEGALGWVATAILGFSTLGYGLLRAAAPALPGAQHDWPPFRKWSAADSLVWLLLGALCLKLLSGRLPAIYSWAGLNLLIVLASIYLVIGAAVGLFYFGRKEVPRLVKILILSALVLMPSLWLLVPLVGVLDTWWDWRRLRSEERPA